MVTDFALEIQNTNATLASLVKDRNSWSHFWKNPEVASFLHNPEGGKRQRVAADVHTPGAASGALPDDTMRMINNNAGMLKSLQRQFDLKIKNAKGGADSSAVADAAVKPPKGGKEGGNRSRNGKQLKRWGGGKGGGAKQTT